jgi:hypothetical protein
MTTLATSPTIAISAAKFVDSIGVNVSMWDSSSADGNLNLVENSLAFLGIVNVRDSLVPWGQIQPEFQALAGLGYKFDFVIPPASTDIPGFVALVDSYVKNYPGSVLAIEGPNEVNIWSVTYNGGSGLANAAQYQQALYAAVRADANLNNIPVYNLTLGTADATLYSQLGNLSSAANYGDSHPYTASGHAPQAGLSYLLPQSQIDAPGLPTVITETGFNTDPNDTYSGTDQAVQAKYTLDILMDAYKDGVAQTFLYQLLDGVSDPNNTTPQDHWGLFNSDGTPKLAATAIHNLTSILNDPGASSSFTPGSLSYTVTNLTTAYGNQLLLEKSNGTFDLVLWGEPTIWNPNTQKEIAAPDDYVTVTFAQVEGTVYVLDPLLGGTPIATYQNVQQIQVDVTDHPLIIEVANAATPLATVVPAPPVVSGFSPDSNIVGDDITNASALTLTGTAAANSTVNVFDGTNLLGTAPANGSGAWSFVTGTLSDATHNFTATATDVAGNTSAVSAALSVTVDTVAPNAPVIATDAIVNTNEVMLTGTAEANSTVNVFEGTTKLGTATADGSGAWSFTTGQLSSGDHAFTATATDAAGNTSLASQPIDPTIDPAAPPSIVAFSPDSGTVGDGITNANKLTLTGTAVANSTVNIYDGITLLGTAASNGSGAWSFTTATLMNGSHSFTATDTVSGATSAASAALAVIVDTVAPAVTDHLASDTGSSSIDMITSNDMLTGSGDPNAVAHFTVDGTPIAGTATANSSGVWTFAPTGLADGHHTIVASETDAAGNTGTASLTFTLDTVAPAVTYHLASDTGSSSTDKITSIDTLTGSGDPNSVVHFTVDGNLIAGTATANSSGVWTFAPTGLANGTHTIVASETDAAGNTGTASLTFTLDTVAPTTTIADIVQKAANNVSTTTISGTSEAGSLVTLYEGNHVLGTATVANTGQWSISLNSLSNKVHNFTAAATDLAGNNGTHSQVAIFGSTGSDNVVGVAAGDIIVSSGGADKLTAGSGNDTFIFNPGFGKDTVSKFDLNHDVLAFDHTLFASVANVLSHAQDINGNAVITFDGGDTVTLVGIKTAQLLAHQNDIHII